MNKGAFVLMTDNIWRLLKDLDCLFMIFTRQKTIPLGDIHLDFG